MSHGGTIRQPILPIAWLCLIIWVLATASISTAYADEGAGPHSMPAESSAHFGWLSLLPPVVAVVVAIALRRVFIALISGIASGALVLAHGNPLHATLRMADTYVLGQLVDPEHVQVILFTLFIGAMVGIMSRSGGTHAIVERMARRAHCRRRGQISGWLLGLGIFFDDYANSLLVGTTMRPLTDRLGISREKLAYIVDSTAAPVAGVALISTWVGTEIGYIQEAYEKLNLHGNITSIFLATILYRSYALLALVFVLLVAWTGRDFGPMLRAEQRAHRQGQPYRPGAQIASAAELRHLHPPPQAPKRANCALIPLLVVVGLVMIGLYLSGVWELRKEAVPPEELTLRNIIGSANSFPVLVASSLIGSITAAALAWGQGILTVHNCAAAWWHGARSMGMAIGILVLAWGLSAQCQPENLNTAAFVVEQAGGYLSAEWLPTLSFLLAAGISFATGTSWGTMGILTPLLIFVAHRVLAAQADVVDPNDPILLATIGGVLAGAIFGDHCSPISDTTVLSSMASGCDHIDHVTTQMPYALTVAAVAVVFGYLPAGLYAGQVVGHPALLLVVGAVALAATLFFTGRKAEGPR